MDEQLKARLIGAVVLVAVAVLLIPELLSGRKPEAPAEEAAGRGSRTIVIDLNSAGVSPSTTAPAASATAGPGPAVLPAPPSQGPSASEAASRSEEPAPEPAARVAEVPGATPAATATGRDARPAPPRPDAAAKPAAPPAQKAAAAVEAPAPAAAKPAARKGGWAVQVGAFGSASAANKLVGELESAGYPAYVSPVVRSGKTLHRVRVGPEAARADADRLAARLKGRNLPATVVAND